MKNKPATDKQVNEMLEIENAKLKKEIEKLHGRLGAQGAAIAREEKYKHLEFELKQMITLYEKQLQKAESLRDMFAAKAMQGLLASDVFMNELNATSKSLGMTGDEEEKVQPKTLASRCYIIADAMLKQKESDNAEVSS